MKYIVLASVLASLMPAVQAQSDPNGARDARLISEVQSVSVHAIDKTLPDVAFKKWLEKESGPEAKFHWEVNDCGEQTGVSGDSGPIPVCVEVDSSLKDGRDIVIFLADNRPKKEAPAEWKIFFAQLVTPHEKINLRRLSDLPAALTNTHQLTKYQENAK
jgi:hypothetical protein